MYVVRVPVMPVSWPRLFVPVRNGSATCVCRYLVLLQRRVHMAWHLRTVRMYVQQQRCVYSNDELSSYRSRSLHPDDRDDQDTPPR